MTTTSTSGDPRAGNSSRWRERPEGGGRFAIRMMHRIALMFGRRVARWLLIPITLYFLLRRGPERRASIDFLTRVHARSATWRDAARHIHMFAGTILDRVYLLGHSFDDFDVAVEGLDALEAQIALGRGVLLVGAHLGSFEILRVLALRRPDIVVRVVLDVRHNAAITDVLGEMNPKLAGAVIDAGQDGWSVVLQIRDALSRGDLVAVLGDRVAEGEPFISLPFLGALAPFPRAPWHIATSLGVPVALCFGLYLGDNRYRLLFEPLTDGKAVDRKERSIAIHALATRYVDRLDALTRAHPHNWFNFHDFWLEPRPRAAADRNG